MGDAVKTGHEPTGMDAFLKGLWEENPVFVMLLGMCPVLAVTGTVMNCIAMGLATLFVLVMSSALVSLFRKFIPKQVRIATFVVIIATFVTIADYTIQAISLEVHAALGAFLPLIVVNCIILGRAEAFASKHSVGKSILDAAGMGIGFTCALLCLGVVREVLGNGTILGIPVFGARFEPWAVMILPPGGFFVLGGWLLFFNWIRERSARRSSEEAR